MKTAKEIADSWIAGLLERFEVDGEESYVRNQKQVSEIMAEEIQEYAESLNAAHQSQSDKGVTEAAEEYAKGQIPALYAGHYGFMESDIKAAVIFGSTLSGSAGEKESHKDFLRANVISHPVSDKWVSVDRQDIICPFCGDDNFDTIGLKYHLSEHCKVYHNTPLHD